MSANKGRKMNWGEGKTNANFVISTPVLVSLYLVIAMMQNASGDLFISCTTLLRNLSFRKGDKKNSEKKTGVDSLSSHWQALSRKNELVLHPSYAIAPSHCCCS
jgi:hypothetical protein